MKYVLTIMALSLLLLTSVSHAEEGYLDALAVNPANGQVFEYDTGKLTFYFDGGQYMDFVMNNSEISENIKLEYAGSVSKSDDLKIPKNRNRPSTQQFLSCTDLKTIKKSDQGIYILNGVQKFNYLVNNRVIGTYEGAIVNRKAILGRYKFINGEEHEIVSCLNDQGNLITYHSLLKLSPKGDSAINKTTKNVKFAYDGQGSSIAVGSQIYSGNNGYKIYDEMKFNVSNIESNDYRFLTDSDLSNDSFAKSVELSKCDGSKTTIKDSPISVSMSNEPISVEYYLGRFKLGKFYGYLTNNNSRISPLLGTYVAANGETKEYTTCYQYSEYHRESRIDKKIVLKTISEGGKKHLSSLAEEITKRDTEAAMKEATENLARDKSRKEEEIAQAKRSKEYDKEQERQKVLLDKLASFRKNLKVGQQVRFIHPYRMRGKVVQVINEYKVKVKITQEDKRDINVWADVKPYTLDISKNDAWYYEKKQTD